MDVSGVPWVNTMAASADGRAWYMDSTPAPNLSQAAIDAWTTRSQAGFTKALADQDIWLLDGSDSRDEWQDDPGARSPGLIAPANMPQLERSDFVFNSNDSHWLTNPLAPLTGYSPMHGFEGTARSMRTRMNARTLLDLLDPDAGFGFAGADAKLDLDELTTAALSNGGYTEQLLRDELVASCSGVGVWDIGGGELVDIAEACDLLASWDGKLDLDSVGAVIWRELLGDFDASAFKDAGQLFAAGFDVTDPVNTPNTLADGDYPLDALAHAVQRLDQAGIALDAPLGEAQFARKGAQRIPIHGGNASEGITNLITHSQLRSDLTPEIPRAEVVWDQTDLTMDGYQINYGTSFIMCMEFTDDGPRGRALLSYSQSNEVDSGWYQDQTELYSQKQWRAMLWTEADIVADPNLVEYDVSGGEPLP